MKLLVTGGCGFIGSAVIRKALSEGHSIVNVDCLTYAASLSSLSSAQDNPAYSFERANIKSADDMARIFKIHQPDAVMHLAAESHVDRSIDGPAEFMQTNVMGTLTLLEAARTYYGSLSAEQKERFRFHHVSTDEVYGDLTPDDPAFSETTPYNPSSPYSASKAASDHIVRAWGRTYGLPVVISNCSNNYGPYQFPEKLIPVVILKALAREPIPVYGTGENIRDWLYVDDHADALLLVLQKGRLGQTYNIGGNNERSNLDIVKTICELMDAKMDGFGHDSLIRFVTDRPGHDQRYAINADKIKSELGWEPTVLGDAGLARTVDWYLDNRNWWQPLLAKNAARRQGLTPQ